MAALGLMTGACNHRYNSRATSEWETTDYLRSNGHPMDKIGPYEAEMLDPLDNGLITRVDKNEKWVCGIFWENTSHVTDHHPADCIHSIVNIGNIPPYSTRVIKGKIYWFEGIKFENWRMEKHCL